MAYPDVSQVLRGDVLREEDRVWNELIHEKEHLAELLIGQQFDNIIEVGCGTGLYARILQRMRPTIPYMGIDSNPEALVLARERNPTAYFEMCDFRTWTPLGRKVDLVCAHAFLKHFCAEEWPALFLKFLALGRMAQFDMQTSAVTFNDGSDSFGNNLWVSENLFAETLAKAGHKIRYSEVAWQRADRKATIYITEAI